MSYADRPIVDRKDDRLRFGRPADALAAQIQRDLAAGFSALTISIEGPWGTGKSSFANLVSNALGARSWDAPGWHDDPHAPLLVHCNLWQSVSATMNPWSAIAYRIGEALYRRLQTLAARGELTVTLGNPHEPRERLDPIEIDQLDDPRYHWALIADAIASEVDREAWSPALSLFSGTPSRLPGRWSGGRKAADALLSVGAAVASGFMGNAGGAVGKGFHAASQLGDSVTARGDVALPDWHLDTREAAIALSTLIRVLHPEADAPGAANPIRIVLVLDDVSRLPRAEWLDVAHALGYLRELDGVVGMLCVDGDFCDEVAAAMRSQSKRDAPPTESFLTRLVDTRAPVPTPDLALLASESTLWAEELPLPQGRIRNHPILGFLRRGFDTPRQLKRALLWLDGRLHGLVEPELVDGYMSGATSKEQLQGVLEILMASYHHVDVGAVEDVLEQMGAGRQLSVLHYLQRQPWDGATWADQLPALHALEGEALRHETLELVGWLRLLATGRALQHGNEPNDREEATHAFERWRTAVVRWTRETLGEDAGPRHVASWLASSRTQMASWIWLHNAARRFQLFEELPADGPFVVAEQWFDLHRAIDVADPRTPHDRRDRATALLLLARFVDPDKLTSWLPDAAFE